MSASAVVSISGDGGSPGAMLWFWACASSATAAGAGVSAGAASASGFRDEAMARGDSYRRVRNLGWFLRMLERTEGMILCGLVEGGQCLDGRRYEIHVRWGDEVHVGHHLWAPQVNEGLVLYLVSCIISHNFKTT